MKNIIIIGSGIGGLIAGNYKKMIYSGFPSDKEKLDAVFSFISAPAGRCNSAVCPRPLCSLPVR